MKTKSAGLMCIGIMLIIAMAIPAIANQNDTTLEFVGISGGFGGVTVEVENTGNAVASGITMTTTIQGGILNGIDLTHFCGGCEDCGTTLGPGTIKTENTMEAGLIMGFGPVQITCVAAAENAQEVSSEASGFVIGPMILI
jgi:hypothetical protein